MVFAPKKNSVSDGMVFVEHGHNLMSQSVTNDLWSHFHMKNLFLGRVTLSAILVAVMATGVLGQTKKILLAGDSEIGRASCRERV